MTSHDRQAPVAALELAEHLSTRPASADDWLTALGERLIRLRAAEPFKLGYPGWSAAFPRELVEFFSHELNNYGDPEVDPVFDWHTKDLERELVDAFADLFAATPTQRWGYVTSGGSEGIMFGLWCARTLLPQARVYHSAAAHSCVTRTAGLLGLQPVAIATDARGEMDYMALHRQLAADGAQAAIIVATIGTTLTEAVDDVPKIRRALQLAGVSASYLHADAAFAGIPLALNAKEGVPFGLNHRGVDSLSFSGHKFLGVPFPCGLVIARNPPPARAGPGEMSVRMCGAPDLVSSSRSGHAALALWFQLRRFGMPGLRDLAQGCRQMAQQAELQLNRAGWNAWRSHPDSLTVVFKTPPPDVLRRWPMPAVRGLSHIVCTPGVTAERVSQFVAALSAATQRKDERCEQP